MTSNSTPRRAELNDLELLRLETSTLCEISESGRVLRGRSPERQAGPRLSLCRSRFGDVVWLRHDVTDATAREIASIALTVGMTDASAEVGVTSMVAFRGRGFAAVAVAGWASHPRLRGRTLFYSTSWSNVSSQRVADRLGLRFVGTRVTID